MDKKQYLCIVIEKAITIVLYSPLKPCGSIKGQPLTAMRRKPIFAEIARLVNLLGNGVYLVYVHRHFDHTYNGKMKLMVNDNGYVEAIGKYGREDWDIEWCLLETMDARHLLRIRNALMRDYGKRVLRGEFEIVPKQ